jgi:hypothetical protein
LVAVFAHHHVERLVLLLTMACSLISHLIGACTGGIDADVRALRLRHRADRRDDWALTLIVIGGVRVLVSVASLAGVLICLSMAKSVVGHVVLTCTHRAVRA